MSKNYVWVIELRGVYGGTAWRPAHMCATRTEARKKAARLRQHTLLQPRVRKYERAGK